MNVIKRIFKGLLKGTIAVVVVIGAAYGGFHAVEYATGGAYVDYLKENSETIPLNESFSFATLDVDIAKNQLILVGEIHGFEEPQKFDYDLFAHVHANHNVRQYYAELDFVQALVLNQYMERGDEVLLHDALQKWSVIQGRNNKDYFDKYRKFHHYYQGLAKDEQFKFIGVDKLQDVQLTVRYLNALNPSTAIEIQENIDHSALRNQLDLLDSVYSHSPDTLFILNHIKLNLEHSSEDTRREEVMFENFSSLYKHLNKNKEKAYGYFGLYHVFQHQVNGQQPLASLLKTSDLGLEDEILSMNFLMVDSYMVTPSNQLPEFMRDSGPYTKMTISADVMLFVYIYGIKDFKRMTPEYHKSLVKMNAENSPYTSTYRMNTIIQLLPVAETFEFNEKGKPYVQYTVFVRNSDWAEPAE